MLAELRQKAQITIPKEIIVKLGLSEGDKLDIFEKDGSICLMPVAVYPKKYLNELKEEINGVRQGLPPGSNPFLTAWTLCLINWRQTDGIRIYLYATFPEAF